MKYQLIQFLLAGVGIWLGFLCIGWIELARSGFVVGKPDFFLFWIPLALPLLLVNLHRLLAKRLMGPLPEADQSVLPPVVRQKQLFSQTRAFPFKLFGLILLAILLIGGLMLLPLMIPAQDEVKRSSNLASMHTLQIMLEVYAQEHQGIYPASLQALYQHASQPTQGYWKEITNPYTGAKGIGRTGALADYAADMVQTRQWLWFSYVAANEPLAGLALYEPVGSPPKNYAIRSFDKQGKLQRHEGKVMVLNADPKRLD